MFRQWKDYWNSYNIANPLSRFMNVWVLVTLLLILVIGLTGFSIKTGNYVKTLEANVTSLQSRLASCNEAKIQSNYDLETCNVNLQNKITSLNSCQTQQSVLSDRLSECNTDLNVCEANYDELKVDYDDVSDKYDNCKSDLNTRTTERDAQQRRADSLQQNYINDYVKDWCCLNFKNTTTSYTYYTLSNNDISCYNNPNVPGAQSYPCS